MSRGSMDSTVHHFFEKLFSRRCFESGAFVISTQHPKIMHFLGSLKAASKTRTFAKTHDTHQSQAKLKKYRVCQATSCTGNVRTLTAGRQYEYIPKRAFRFACTGASTYGVLLWYVFTLNGKGYVYFKLESHPGAHPMHVVGAIRRYILKKPKTSQHLARRENAFKNAGFDKRKALEVSHQNSALWGGNHTEANRYNASGRTGMEVFVPSFAAVHGL